MPAGNLVRVKAVAKTRSGPGLELIETDAPEVLPGQVKVEVQAASICGTDLHIYEWDEWSSGRMKPPTIVGHEFCGRIIEVGAGVEGLQVGDYVASESHIVCGKCKQCQLGQGHVCVNTKLLGIDVDGGFRRFAVVPATTMRLTPESVPPHVACVQDPLGNAVHTVLEGPVEGQTILITGLGPIGLFSVAVCRALGAACVIGTEVNPIRMDLARELGIDFVFDARDTNLANQILAKSPGGVDGVLEMSGHPSALDLAVRVVRPGGRISLLGIFAESKQTLPINELIFKGVVVQPIVGRKLWQTWDQMGDLLQNKGLNIEPVITHRLPFTDFSEGFNLLRSGKAGKVVLEF
jgi:threonine 3-dehydrogenase